MSSFLQRSTKTIVLVFVVFTTVETAQAVTGNYFSSFGRVYNDATDISPGGECYAASFINGTIYLKNQYPAIFGSTDITKGGTSSSEAAMHNFGSYGWMSGGNYYHGYYERCHLDNNTAVFGDMWQTTVDWMQNSFAPGKTSFSGQAWTDRSKEDITTWAYSSNLTNCPPTFDFMRDAVVADKFVELSIYTYETDNNGKIIKFARGHAVNLLNITQTSITFQDPNSPGTAYTSSLSSVSAFGQSALSFYDAPSFGTSPVVILTAFALCPVPEPSTIALLIMAVAGGLLLWQRRR